jgi:hypothetical protein
MSDGNPDDDLPSESSDAALDVYSENSRPHLDVQTGHGRGRTCAFWLDMVGRFYRSPLHSEKALYYAQQHTGIQLTKRQTNRLDGMRC